MAAEGGNVSVLGRGARSALSLLAVILWLHSSPTWAQRPTLAQAPTPQTELQARPGEPSAAWPVEQFTLRTLSPQDDDFSDLAPLARELAGVRVLALGEQTHGGREEFLAKLRLLRYAHEHLGFDVLLLESGFYDIGRLSERMAAGERLDELAPGNVFYMYANTAEGRQLLQYLDQQQAGPRPILLAGFDSQHSGALSTQGLLPDLRRRLLQRAPALAVDAAWQPFEALAQALFTLRPPVPTGVQQTEFSRSLAEMRQALCSATAPTERAGLGTDAWWCQLLGSLQSQARSLWSQGRDFQRDAQMGAHAIWLMEQQYPGKKAVVWAHTVHVARGFSRGPLHPQAGEVMARHWGAAYKVLQFSASGGEVLDYVRGLPQPVPAPAKGSLEARLTPSGVPGAGPAAAVLLARAPVLLPQHSYDYQDAGVEMALGAGRLGVNWDILVHIPRMSPVQMVR